MTASRTLSNAPDPGQRDWLKSLLPSGSRVTTICLHTSRSGMKRHYIVLVAAKDGLIADIGHEVADAIGLPWDVKRGTVVMSGTGSDMARSLVQMLSNHLGLGINGLHCHTI